MYYNFYFDETFHDRRIKIDSSGKINIDANSTYDGYIGVFWGSNNRKCAGISKSLLSWEEKYIKRYGITDEFKSTVIARKNFSCGIRTFNKNAFDFYNDFFGILEAYSPIIHVNIVSKIELLVRSIFEAERLRREHWVNLDTFYYSLSKFILVYHSQELMVALHDSAQSGNGNLFKEVLLDHLKKVIDALEGIKRKETEIPALKRLHRIISGYEFGDTICNSYDFVYFQNFDGLMRLLSELNISYKKVNVLIDQEEKTYLSAKKFPFREVKQLVSTESIYIRTADHICGFIGRMMQALTEDEQFREDIVVDINKLGDNDLVRKHLVRPQWFELQRSHFELYKKVANVLIVQQSAYWSTMTWTYCDQAVMFYSLLRYIASYNTFEDFSKVTSEMHAEYYNFACCEDLERHFYNLNRRF